MNQLKRNLILAPHIDDEALGCYSALNENSHVCYMGVENRSYVTAAERIKELNDAAHAKSFSWKIFENTVNSYNVSALIPLIEEQINTYKPEKVYVPHYSYNKDHQAVYDSAMIALRHHDKNWFVKHVFIYEQPHTILWPVKSFEPNFFIKIDIEDKIRTYQLYESQVREHRSAELIRTMAALRGKQANIDFAEAFNCIRFVID
jgi:N-acetylglucosamine malate deacetylase 1